MIDRCAFLRGCSARSTRREPLRRLRLLRATRWVDFRRMPLLRGTDVLLVRAAPLVWVRSGDGYARVSVCHVPQSRRACASLALGGDAVVNPRGVYGRAVRIAADPTPGAARGEGDQGPRLGTIVKTGAVVWIAIWILAGITDPRPGDILRTALRPRKDWRQP